LESMVRAERCETEGLGSTPNRQKDLHLVERSVAQI
jgi:hypothetical protein